MTNQEIAQIFYEMAALAEMESEHFKGRAYDKVALLIESLSEEVDEIYRKEGLEGLEKFPGVGKNIAHHIADLIEKGTFSEYVELKKKIPVDVAGLLAVEGVGPKNVKTLWEKLGIRSVADLEQAAREGKIKNLEHFGEKSQQKILEGIEFLKTSGGRKVLGYILPEVKKLEEKIRLFENVGQVAVAGSVRRRKETIGDIDILVTSKKPSDVMDQFVKLPEVQKLIARGPTKASVKLKSGINADLRVVEEKSFGAAKQYFTGSKAHNIQVRHIAVQKGWKLNEYGLFKKVESSSENSKEENEGWEYIAGKTEKDVYEKLGLAYIEPELREGEGEVEAAQQNKLPFLVGYGDLKGDLQVQTRWTDGKNSIEEMAEAAMKMGLEYIAITDHTKSLSVTNGLDERRLKMQMKEIEELNEKLKKQKKKFRVLKGSEVDILKDGSLDIDDETLAKLDVVGAAVHKHFELPKKQQTERIIRAMENPNVDIIFHLTTRVIGRRKVIELDLEKIIKAAKRTKTVLEIDAFPDRLDINDQLVRRCVAEGVKMSVDSDAHMLHHLNYLEYGIAQARRGWAEKKDIINAHPAEKMLKMLK